MKKLILSLTMSLGVLANGAQAEQTLNIDGKEYPLSVLLKNCQSITDQPEAQIACFAALSQLMEAQSSEGQQDGVSVTQALDDLREVAEYQDEESGLSVSGSGCRIQIVYFSNYFHISRRNISTIDLYSAKFDASKLRFDQVAKGQGAQALLSKATMEDGATAGMRGGLGLESKQHNFAPRSPRTTLADYANEVADQLQVREDQAFEFALVHPQRSQASDEIWSAFETYLSACQGGPPSS